MRSPMDHRRWIGLCQSLAAVLLFSFCFLTRGAADDSANKPIKTLVHGTVNSEAYEDLLPHLAITQDDGQQDASQFDLLIFDGTQAEAAQDAVLSTEISKALYSGHWVLAFDANAKVKTDYFQPVIYFSTPGKTRSYLVRSVKEQDGDSSWRIFTTPSATPGGLTLSSEQDLAFDDADGILARLQDPHAGEAPVAASDEPGTVADPVPPDSAIPPGLIHARWYHQMDTGPVLLPQPAKKSDAAKQYFRLLINSTYTAFLNNSNNASGDFQYLVLQVDGSLNPTNGTGHFAHNAYNERAWFDDVIRVYVEPPHYADPSLNLYWVNNAPITPNSTSSYSASSSFSVGYQTGSYTWGTSKTFEIPRWKVSSNAAGVNMAWNFRSASPNADIPYNKCASDGAANWFNICGVRDNGYPNEPNELSRTQNVFHASVVYRTQGLRTGRFALAVLDGRAYPRLFDLFCTVAGGSSGICLGNQSWSTTEPLTGFGAFIDLSVVVPIPLQHMTFSQNPAVAGNKITGQIFLVSPAAVNTSVALTSLNPNRIHVPASVVIEKGKTSTTFAVVTTAGSAGLDTAIVTATYAASSIPEPFSVRTYTPGQLLPPTTVVTTNPSYWTEHLPFGKWVSGFQVRYAVSFVDAQGQETDRGPWTPWFGNPDYALPILFDVPTGPSNTVVKRRIYRQFYADVDDSNPQGGVELVGEIDDNTTTQFRDQAAN